MSLSPKLPRPDKEIFFEALDLSSTKDREQFLTCHCKDAAQRKRIDKLLGKHFTHGGFMQEPAGELLPPAQAEVIGEQIGRYRLLQKIGEGGFGIVFVAEQSEPVRRKVALKVIKAGMDTRQVVARFEAERQALAMMDHPNIAKVLDAGATEAGRPYFVMELVDGVPITKFCDQNQLSTQERLRLFLQVCQAIQHAHQKGIIHRDIKPSNILVSLSAGATVPRVIDFGIAKATEGRLADTTLFTSLTQFIGTPAYMSPEQSDRGALDVDTRTDIYSLGVLLYELLTGSPPFDPKKLIASGIDAMRKVIREDEPPRPSTRVASLQGERLQATARQRSSDGPRLINQLKGDVDWIILKCLEKDRAQRYESVSDLAADLQRHLADEPVIARPQTAVYKIRKFARRNRATVIAVTAIAVFLIAGIAISSWQAIAATRARAESEKNLYIANMTLAQHAWEKNIFPGVRQLLNETAHSPIRGFEWYYFWRQLHMDVRRLNANQKSVDAVAYSPDGLIVAAASVDGTTAIWRAQTGEAMFTLQGHIGPVSSVAFSPNGLRIATGGRDATVRVWDATTGKELYVFRNPTGRVWSVGFSADSQRILSSGDGGSFIWDASTGAISLTLRGDFPKSLFSPDNKIIAGFRNEVIQFWNAADGSELFTTLPVHAWLPNAAFSPDGQTFAVGTDNGWINIHDLKTRQRIADISAHSTAIFGIAFSPDSRRIVTAGDDGLIRFWDVATRQLLFTCKGNNGSVTSVAFSPDGRHFITGSPDGTARIWLADRSSSSEPLKIVAPFGTFVYSARFSSDGKRLLMGNHDHIARLYNPDTGQELIQYVGHSQSLSGAIFFPDDSRILTASVDGSARIWETASGRQLLRFDGHGTEPVYTFAISPDGQRVFTGSVNMPWENANTLTGIMWNSTNGQELLTIKGIGRWATFSPDGRHVASGSHHSTSPMTTIWDSFTGQPLLALPGLDGPVAYSPDGRHIVTAARRQAKVWDARTGAEIASLHGHTGAIHSVAYSPDGQRIVTASDDQTARLWHAQTGKELLTLTGHNARMSAATFSPDGYRIATCGLDGAFIWQAATPEEVARRGGW